MLMGLILSRYNQWRLLLLILQSFRTPPAANYPLSLLYLHYLLKQILRLLGSIRSRLILPTL